MANKYTSIEDLIKESVRVYNGMIAVWPQYGKEEEVNFECATFNGANAYCSNNGTLAFIFDKQLYVTPSTTDAFKILDEECFSEKYFYVPFSNGDFPKREQFFWEGLKVRATESYHQEFLAECAKYCAKSGIGTPSESVFMNALEIPKEGMRIRHVFGSEDRVFPTITNDMLLSSYDAEKLGTYCTNNGRVVFVTSEARTFVTKGYRILVDLQRAGYKEASIFVPLSNGEEILDPVLAARWEQIKK